MSNIQIITDSMTDVPRDIIEKYNIKVAPLTINFGGEEFRDSIDISPKEFYEKISNLPELPKTSQVPPSTFAEVFKEVLGQGKEIICINGSSRASGTHQSAIIAKNELESDKISLVDSLGLCFGAGMLVYEAARLVEQGIDRQTISKRLEELKKSIDHIFTVDTMENLKKGGRINPMKASIATMLNIKPILTVVDGLVEPLDKVRGSKKVISKMIEIAKERGADFKENTICIAHADNPERLKELKQSVMDELKPREIIVAEIGCTIGTHCGKGTLALFYKNKF
ncbi:DegV family protein [Serpentinicella alkaliphila]|uniref:DegV family protein with EDD domain n=1 Tax=Serpentinicella alkaliphila TaxID=1734049 RepID=A0A4R2U3B1_9FIRM|nr:DegV family protein [Serpentinicella alkaliphila]QUH25989.1 DegV family protein [Serpentinicella alkaliphila]TCQ02153.1 DegV family protein with EDD domain [Serpentinicella alkaliphila]